MFLRLVTVLSSMFFFLAKTHADTMPAEIRVFDRDQRLLAHIVDKAQLTVFNEIWATKQRVPGKPKPRSEFHYSIILAGKGIWLYSPDGYITRLDHLEHPRYRLIAVEKFNKILSIVP